VYRVIRAFADTSMEAYLAFLCLLGGLPMLFDQTLAPGSLLALLPPWLILIWAVILVIGGVLVLLGIGKPWLLLERAGISLLGGGAFVYAIVLFAYAASGGLLVFLTYGLFALAALGRYRYLGRVHSGIKRAQEIRLKE